MKFRELKANEIDCRVSTINAKGLSLLLYKDARVDQNILDEEVGPMNWQRSHSRENANCTVSIWDSEKKQWISKEDTGTESYTEAEKGLASDSFKRACFNWGIGRELYTAPFIWIEASMLKNHEQDKGRWKSTDRFEVSQIGYDSERQINSLVIRNKKTKKIVYTMVETTLLESEPEAKPEPETEETAPEEPTEIDAAKIAKQKIGEVKVKALRECLKNNGIPEDKIYKLYKVKSLEELTEAKFSNINEHLEDIKKL